MKITREDLQHFDACEQSIKVIFDKYPDGAELLEIANTIEMPLDWLYFGRKYFKFSEQEEAKYNELCRIKNSHNVWASHDIESSKNIVKSSEVSNSDSVVGSKMVDSSNHIYYGSEISLSEEILDSECINLSNLVVGGRNVIESSSIAYSYNIEASKNIINSYDINQSKYIYNSNNLNDCYFCGFLRNCTHCMFCTQLEDAQYYIFNEPVEPDEFERIKNILCNLLENECSTFITVDENTKIKSDRIKYNASPDSVFDGLSDDFYGTISALPNYTDDKFLILFFKENEAFGDGCHGACAI